MAPLAEQDGELKAIEQRIDRQYKFPLAPKVAPISFIEGDNTEELLTITGT